MTLITGTGRVQHLRARVSEAGTRPRATALAGGWRGGIPDGISHTTWLSGYPSPTRYRVASVGRAVVPVG
jgi:hypothetical protein